jgi:hypothetical protein
MSINYGELVLVRDAFIVVAGLLLVRFANKDLGSAEVNADGDRLYLKSAKPQDATGSVEPRVALPDAETWRELLIARGAQPHTN